MLFPLAIGASCVVTSIIGTFFVKLGANNSIMGALYKGFIATAVLSLVVLLPVTAFVFGGLTKELTTASGLTFTPLDLYVSGVVGLVVTGLIVWITEYYTGTGFRPVQSIAKA
jgi:K(+)-stimulated pyrophosphate-energized sodium pump